MSVQIVESDMTKELVPHDVINVKPKKKQKERTKVKMFENQKREKKLKCLVFI